MRRALKGRVQREWDREPDIGVTRELPRLPGCARVYNALTQHRIPAFRPMGTVWEAPAFFNRAAYGPARPASK